jgi:signal transduction histidine kinase
MWKKNYCATSYNFGPSLTIIMGNGNQYFEKKIMSKNLHNAISQILIDVWQLMMLAWHHVCSYNGVA